MVHSFCTCSFGGVRHTASDKIRTVSQCCVDVCEYCKEVAGIPRSVFHGNFAASKFRNTGAFINPRLPPLRTDVFVKLVESTGELVDEIDKLLQAVEFNPVDDVYAEIDERVAKIDKNVAKFKAVYAHFVDKKYPYRYNGVSLFEAVHLLPVKNWQNGAVWNMCEELEYEFFEKKYDSMGEMHMSFGDGFFEATNCKDEKIKGMIGEFRV